MAMISPNASVPACRSAPNMKLVPIPVARAKGMLAYNPMNNVISALTMAQVTARASLVITSPFTSVKEAASPNPMMALGCTTSTYAIVIKVVKPARISVFTLVPFSLSLKNDCNFPILFFSFLSYMKIVFAPFIIRRDVPFCKPIFHRAEN